MNLGKKIRLNIKALLHNHKYSTGKLAKISHVNYNTVKRIKNNTSKIDGISLANAIKLEDIYEDNALSKSISNKYIPVIKSKELNEKYIESKIAEGYRISIRKSDNQTEIDVKQVATGLITVIVTLKKGKDNKIGVKGISMGMKEFTCQVPSDSEIINNIAVDAINEGICANAPQMVSNQDYRDGCQQIENIMKRWERPHNDKERGELEYYKDLNSIDELFRNMSKFSDKDMDNTKLIWHYSQSAMFILKRGTKEMRNYSIKMIKKFGILNKNKDDQYYQTVVAIPIMQGIAATHLHRFIDKQSELGQSNKYNVILERKLKKELLSNEIMKLARKCFINDTYIEKFIALDGISNDNVTDKIFSSDDYFLTISLAICILHSININPTDIAIGYMHHLYDAEK